MNGLDLAKVAASLEASGRAYEEQSKLLVQKRQAYLTNGIELEEPTLEPTILASILCIVAAKAIRAGLADG